jgi:hypothetical protein
VDVTSRKKQKKTIIEDENEGLRDMGIPRLRSLGKNNIFFES